MKIFMVKEFSSNTTTISIEIKGKIFTLAGGLPCSDAVPVWGAEFPNDDEFIELILFHFGKKEAE